MNQFSFDDMEKIDRMQLGAMVPLALFRTIRLIGMHQGLPLGGKGTTVTVGRKIGEHLPVRSLAELFQWMQDMKVGIPSIVHEDERVVRVAVEDCFCKGLPVLEEKLVCDLEGAIMEGAINQFSSRKATVQEVKCNVRGDACCEYEIRYKR